MNYLNPFTLTGIDPDKPLDAETLRRAKTRLLNRFELEGTTTVRFEGVEMDRQTVLTTVEQLANPAQAELHRQLALYPGLLQFMRTSQPKHLDSVPDPSRFSRAFIAWVSPWFAPAFAQCMEQLLQKGSMRLAYDLMQSHGFIAPAEYAVGHAALLKWIQLIQLQTERNKYDKRGLAMIASPEMPQILALLPDVYKMYNDEWGKLILLRADQLLRIGGNAQAEDLLIHADALRVSPPIRELINKKLSDIQKGHARPTTGTRDLPEMDEPLTWSDIPWGWVIQALVVLGLAAWGISAIF